MKEGDMENILRVNLRFRWYKLLLFLVEAGLIAFGVWAFVDSVLIGASHAGYRFLLLFVVWSLPGMAVLVFVRPRTETKPRNHASGQDI
jgi:hypothetical protein